MSFGSRFAIGLVLTLGAWAWLTNSATARGGFGGGGYRGGPVAARSYGGGYYHGGAVYAGGGAYRSGYAGYRGYNTYGNYNYNRNYTGVYGGRTGYWNNGRWYSNTGYYGGGIYAGGVWPYYGGVYYGGGTTDIGYGAPTIVQAPEQNTYPVQPPTVIYTAPPVATVPPRPTPVGGVFVPVQGQSYVQATSNSAVVVAQQMYYLDQKYYYYGGNYYQAHLQGAEIGYHKIAPPAGISAPPQNAPKSIITIQTKG